jgi:transcription elongation factor GreA
MDKFPITAEGFEKLNQELKHLKNVERPSVIAAISEAREHGDLSENAEYHAAKEKQSFIEGKIIALEDKIARSELIDPVKLSGDTVKFGATVRLLDLDNQAKISYKIVGEYESDKGLLSINSPIARAMLGRKKDDFIEVKTPASVKEFQILEICFI